VISGSPGEEGVIQCAKRRNPDAAILRAGAIQNAGTADRRPML
jgi:hypothetical protein